MKNFLIYRIFIILCIVIFIANISIYIARQYFNADILSFVNHEDNQLETKVEQDAFVSEIEIIKGTVNDNVVDSLHTAGLPLRLANKLPSMFSNVIDFRSDIKNGDTFEVKLEVQKDNSGEIIKIGDILYAKFHTDNCDIKLYRFVDNLHNEEDTSGPNLNPKGAKVIMENDLNEYQLAEFKNEVNKIDAAQDNISIIYPSNERKFYVLKYDGIKLLETSVTLTYGTKEYFYIYNGKDISKANLDSVIEKIRSKIGDGVGFSLYDDEVASELAYMNWVSMASYSSFPQSFHDELKYCYNYRREHSLVEADSTGLVVFSNYELDKTYQENRRNGLYKYCHPKEFVEQNIQKVRDIDNQRKDERKAFEQISSNRQLKQQCWDIIKTKFRYVNDLVFNSNMSINQRNDTYTFSGILNVETTNGLQANAEYECVYDNDKKEFVDWFVGELEATTWKTEEAVKNNTHTNASKKISRVPARKPKYVGEKNQVEKGSNGVENYYPLCNPRYLFFTQDKCKKDNVNGNFFRVLQQTPDGTLVSFIKSPDYVLFISQNPKDASLADNSPIYDGSFAVDGTYQYSSILGNVKTVKKLKRLK